MSPMSNVNTTTSAPSTSAGNSPCGCADQTPSQPCCCNLVCFDRPNYFCGHLLTDADLTLQQKYVVEKNKLYHRTMDGYGIVCGLKLTCDCDCKGNILIHDGFAIDDCGNDLVVCQTTRFDVIHALRSKGLLVTDPPEDDCEPRHRHEHHKSHCHIRQCFYVTICYNESESEYETPFQSSCTSGPKACMPTRTHEGVRFDVTKTLPREYSYCEDLPRRIRECFELNCDSPLGRIVKDNVHHLQYIFGECGDDSAGRITPRRACELFCELRAYFLNYLKTKPDQFNCNLYEEVACLSCPGECYEEIRPLSHGIEPRKGDPRDDRIKTGSEGQFYDLRCFEKLREPLGKLLYYMQRYQYDCVLGDLVFNCQQPCEAHCLVLGTVEVLDGRLIRVCNSPRRYLKTPANLLEVLIHDVLTKRMTRGEEREGRPVPCCPDYDKFSPCHFLTEFDASTSGRYEAAASLIRAICEFGKCVENAFDFSDSTNISYEVFAGLDWSDKDTQRKLEAIRTLFGVSVSEEKIPAPGLNALTPMQCFQSRALLRRNDRVVAFESGERTREVLTDLAAQISPNREIGQYLEQFAINSEDRAREMRELRAEFEALKRKLDEDSKKPGKKSGAQQKEE